jgi:hypothetical protein
MPALTIFTMSIKYLKEHFTVALNKQKTGIVDTDIQYVITVPAIWNDNAKQFMREAAEKVTQSLNTIDKFDIFLFPFNRLPCESVCKLSTTGT